MKTSLPLLLLVTSLLGACVARDKPEGALDPSPTRSSAPRAAAAPVEAPTLHLVRTSGSPVGPIPYLSVEPADATHSTPIIIALHGRGSRAESFARFVEGMRLRARFVVGRGPLPWGQRGGRQWFGAKKSAPYEGVLERVEDLGRLLDQLSERYPGSPRPWLLGFSQGAMLSLQAAALMPERLGGVVALSGALPFPLVGKEAAAPLPLFLTAGAHDHLIPPEQTQAAARRLSALGHAPQVVSFEGGHSVPPEILRQAGAFLARHF